MQEILEYLSQHEYENVYIIRGLVNKINDFRYEVEHSDNSHISGLVAFWEYDKAVTLRGNKIFCEKWLIKLCAQYNFYDLEKAVINSEIVNFIKEVNGNPISYYLVMAYEPEKSCISDKLIEYIEYIKVDKDEWNRISKIYRDTYNKEFTKFNPKNMEWVCVYDQVQVIANLCLERVYGNLIVLSNFYVIPNMRGQGIVINSSSHHSYIVY